MELKPVKRKKFTPLKNYLLFPSSNSKKCSAYFDGVSIDISSCKDINGFDEAGFFGRGSLSKNVPVFNTVSDDLPELLLEQQWHCRQLFGMKVDSVTSKKCYCNELSTNSINKFLQQSLSSKQNGLWSQWKKETGCFKELSASSKDICKYSWDETPETAVTAPANDPVYAFVNTILKSGKCRAFHRADEPGETLVVGPTGVHVEPSVPAPKEVLCLTFCEAYFLTAIVDKLTVFGSSGVMSVEDLWKTFSSVDNNFIPMYVAYHWYRSRGWVVRSGLKYGGDFVLYEKGPPFCHSSYVVRVCAGKLASSWDDLFLIQRLCETFNKDVVFCHVIRPDDLSQDELSDPAVISRFSVSESMCRRWIPQQNRAVKQ